MKEKFDAEQVINADLTVRVEDLENSNSALAADLENANDNLKNEQEHNSDLSEENAELVHFAKGHNFFQQFGKQTLQNRRTHF